jgi:hypothetical protein
MELNPLVVDASMHTLALTGFEAEPSMGDFSPFGCWLPAVHSCLPSAKQGQLKV